MKIIVISSSPVISRNQKHFAYTPYVKELEIWARHAGEIAFMCPVWKEDRGLLISEMAFRVSKIFEAREFNIKSYRNLLMAVWFSFRNFYRIFLAMLWADHIHLRCPGNIGLMGCIIQIFFPHKPKTAKYAGNWDPKAEQPLSYRIQKWILNNTFLTRKMQVLVYGEWEGSSANIKPFFTASYSQSDKVDVAVRTLDKRIEFIFAGTLAPGKRPLYAVRLVEKLHKNGFDVCLSIYGNGKEKQKLSHYISENKLENIILLKGNQPQEIIKRAYQQSHFLILPSKSEGWPKVVAEAMFWGCLPIASAVSCLPFMLARGERGMLLSMNLEDDVVRISGILQSQDSYADKISKGVAWSRQYTLDLFEKEIKALLNQ